MTIIRLAYVQCNTTYISLFIFFPLPFLYLSLSLSFFLSLALSLFAIAHVFIHSRSLILITTVVWLAQMVDLLLYRQFESLTLYAYENSKRHQFYTHIFTIQWLTTHKQTTKFPLKQNASEKHKKKYCHFR